MHSDKGSTIVTSIRGNSRDKKVNNVVKTKDVNLPTLAPKGNPKFCADIKRKNSLGNSNWMKFLEETRISSKKAVKVNENPKVIEKPENMRHLQVVPDKRVTKVVKLDNAKYQDGKKVTKAVAIDCEMVGIGNGTDDMLARVSIVNSLGECLYDTFVAAREPVTDYRTEVSGVRPCDMENGKDFETVQKEVASLLHGKIVVGHSLKSDFSVLMFSHPKHMIRDTSKFFRETGKGTPSLKKLALKYLNASIQDGEHNSVQDANAAMQLYNMFRKHWERGRGRNKSHNSINNYVNYLEISEKS